VSHTKGGKCREKGKQSVQHQGDEDYFSTHGEASETPTTPTVLPASYKQGIPIFLHDYIIAPGVVLVDGAANEMGPNHNLGVSVILDENEEVEAAQLAQMIPPTPDTNQEIFTISGYQGPRVVFRPFEEGREIDINNCKS